MKVPETLLASRCADNEIMACRPHLIALGGDRPLMLEAKRAAFLRDKER